MHGDFKISIKKHKGRQIIAALQDLYPANDLNNAYQRSQFKEAVDKRIFSFGYQDQDVLLLARITDGELKITLENLKNESDLFQLKDRIDTYHNQVKTGLNSRRLHTHLSSATITLEDCEINGVWPNKLRDLWDVIQKKGEKIILEPIAAIIVSFLALHYKIFDAKECSGDIKKTLIVLAEAYVGVIVLLVIKIFMQKTKKSLNLRCRS